MKRMNGWQRIGVVANAMWVLFVIGFTWWWASGQVAQAYSLQAHCELNSIACDFDTKTTAWQLMSKELDTMFWFMALPSVLMWLIGGAVFYVVRWIKLGFKTTA